jgi:hypothetical protein
MRTLNHAEIGSVAGGLSVPYPGSPLPPLINDLHEKLREAAEMRDATRHLLNPPSWAVIEDDNGK